MDHFDSIRVSHLDTLFWRVCFSVLLFLLRCRFCSLSCEDHCASIDQLSGCDCVECPDDLEMPPVPSYLLEERASAVDGPSCAGKVDGDAFCLEQVRHPTSSSILHTIITTNQCFRAQRFVDRGGTRRRTITITTPITIRVIWVSLSLDDSAK